jgi:hypothetical protein
MLKDCKGEGRVHGEVRPHTMVMLLAAASRNAAKGTTIVFCSRTRRILRGKRRGGVGVHFVQCARARLSQRVDLRVTCEMRGMRSEVVGLLNFGGKTDSEVN